MTTTFEKEVYIPFQLSDPAGIVFFGHVFAIAHEVYEFFVQEILEIQWDQWFNNGEWIVPIKESQARFFLPLHAGQKYIVSLNLLQMSTSSLTFSYLFKKENSEHCFVQTLHVFCNRHTKTKQSIPTEIHQRLKQYLC